MKYIVVIALMSGIMALCGCSSEKTPEPAQKIPAITLSPADKKKLQTFQKDILNVESLADKAVKLAGEELKKVVKGEEASISLASLVDRAKSDCLLAGKSLAKKTVPETLPPELKKPLNEGKSGLIAAYTAYAESFTAIKSFVSDKNPMALLEYRKKYSQAQEHLAGATGKFKSVMNAVGGNK